MLKGFRPFGLATEAKSTPVHSSTNRASQVSLSQALEERYTLAPALAIAVALILVAAFKADSIDFSSLPLLSLGSIAFTIPQIVSPRLRLRRDRPLCPSNWAWFLFAVVLIGQPVLIYLYGPARGQLTQFPSNHAIQVAFLTSCVSYWAFGLGAVAPSRHKPPPAKTIRSTPPPLGLVLVMTVVGLGALAWRFHSPQQVFQYFTGGYTGDSSAQQVPTSFSEAASTFLRPLGAYGLILLWARGSTSGHRHRLRLLLCTVGALGILATYNYNRAAVVIPLVALAAAYSRHIGRLSFRTLLVCGLVTLIIAFSFGNFRRIELGTQGGKYTLQQTNLTASPSLESDIQLYGAAPQFEAVVIQNLETSGKSYLLGSTLYKSVLSPLPVLGKGSRSQNGTTLYNAVVYGRPGVADQVIPFVTELYWNFGIWGVIVGFWLLGLVLSRLQRMFDHSEGLVASFILQYFAMWSAFLIIGSLQVVSQICIYFSLPAILLIWFGHRSSMRPYPDELGLVH